MFKVLQQHWPEYLMEAFGLGAFMVSAGLFATLLYAPTSPMPDLVPSEFVRGLLMGIAMGLTAIVIIYSPWGKRSGAHINPAVTLTFFRLGKLTAWDTFYYVLSQFVGAVLGIGLVAIVVGDSFTNRPVNYIVTAPGQAGWLAAIGIEFLMAFGLMLMVLFVSNQAKWGQFTGLFAGGLVATYITLFAPISGMSINPARTFGSALAAQSWDFFWIYYLAPPLAMLTAAEVYLRVTGSRQKYLCGKLCPNDETPCLCTFCPCCDQGSSDQGSSEQVSSELSTESEKS